MGEPTAEKVTVTCHCGARLKVPARAIGKRAKCPKCGEAFLVSQPADDAGDGWLDDLVGQEHAAPAAAAGSAVPPPAASAAIRPCPNCGAAMSASAKTCPSCGGKRKRAATTSVATGGADVGAAVAGAAAKAARVAGTFVLGCILSVVGAGIGAAIWYIVAMKTHMEIGYVAWAVGGLAGFGMAFGSRRAGAVPGAVAALVSVVAIVAAKVLIFVTVLAAILTGDTSDKDAQKSFVKVQLIQEELRSQGVEPARASEAQWNAARDSAGQRVEKMKPSELASEFKRLHQADQERREAAAAAAKASKPAAEVSGAPPATGAPNDGDDEGASGDDSAGAGQALFSAFFGAMFGIIDIVFVILAMATAYKVGSSGLEFGSS